MNPVAATPLHTDRARAYCGDAHHQECAVSGDDPPQYVDLPVASGTRRYRLVRHPLTGRPARDPDGALVFVPARPECCPAAGPGDLR